ncbi:WD40/YVTN/BNR-like repeat-containing protein [Sphingomonas nostoxanthinifaciens]|uniref:WD40/YVTN/BNR-like repeat-containing protein n=1 Tax=Sphingomonas nostoxanthinifaciens TaxID=2872652 RepID=UPI001CC2199C|nr:glycosyl hydrolase [Sphingomonas nostoxanthinifaciens]UAK23222.1 glycosyl hydrolase [Sphingomonas nostoxanthinifaciens]
MVGLRLARIFLCGLLAGSSIAHAQSDVSFGPLKWRNIGPNRGGRSITAAGSPGRPLEYYFGAVGGGLWKTTDGGTSWAAVTDQKIGSSSVGAVAVAPSNPDIVYVGMGETELRGNVMQGDGVYKSTDGGKTWKNIGLRDTQSIARIRVDPKDPNLVYVAALGHPYDKSSARGVYRSRDGGATWQKILYKNDVAGAVDLSIDPNDPKTMFAAIWDVYRTPWSLSSGGPASGLYKSTDGGDTWTDITRNPGLPSGIVGKIGVAVSGADSKRIFAMVENENGGVFRSDDGGATWAKVNDDRKVRQRNFYYTRVYTDPKNKDVVYAMNTSFFRSTDGGKTFKSIPQLHGDNHDLWIDPNDPDRMVQANDGGASVSVNGGKSWTQENYPTAQLYHVATTADIPYQVCGAQQDNSTLCVPSDDGENFRDPTKKAGDWLYAVGGGESGYIAPDPTDPDIFYAGSQGALLTRYNRHTGISRDVQVYPLFFSGMPAKELKERWQWTFPIVFDPLDPNTIYTSSQHLFRTTDKGQSWATISPDLTRADPKTLGDSGGPITHDQNGPEIYGTIFAVAPSRTVKGEIWTGSDDGLAYLTRDAGKTWAKITPAGLPNFSRISIIDASWHDAATAYLAANRYQLGDRAPYIFRTHDYGRTWTKIVAGIPADDFPRVVREDPVREGMLYAGTEHGIYLSYDDGDHWQSLRLNLPDTQVSDITIHGADVVIATHGRSFYILDDVAALRQYAPGIAAEPLHLYAPRPMTSGVDKAVIDYSLAKPATHITIEVLKDGQVVHTASGDAAADKEAEKAEENTGGDDRPKPKPPTRLAGLNRTEWNGYWPGAVKFSGMILWGASADRGPMALPGDYQLRVTADGVVQTQTLTILPDPRTPTVTAADLDKQYKLAMRLRDEVSQANTMVIHIRDLRAKLADDAKAAPGLDRAAAPLLAKLTTIEEALYQVRNRSGQDPLNFPIKLNNQIAALMRVAMDGPGAPTDQSYVVADVLTARLAAQQTAYDQAMAATRAKLNPILAKAGRPAIAG